MQINHSSAQGNSYYTYSATGVKLQVSRQYVSVLPHMPIIGLTSDNPVSRQETTDYIGNIIYETQDGNMQLKRILVDNGYIENGNYYFYIRDHLGNNRIVAGASGSNIFQYNFLIFPCNIKTTNQTYVNT